MRRQEHFVFQNAHFENLMLICEAKGKLWAITSYNYTKKNLWNICIWGYLFYEGVTQGLP
jgi:hypothetical protein